MRSKGRKVLGLAALLMACIVSLQGVGGATDGSATDPTGDQGASSIDVTEARHTDGPVDFTWSFHTNAVLVPESELDTAQWDLDLNSNGVYSEAADACIQMAPLFNGSQIMRASLKPGCGATIAGTDDATFTGGNDVTISFPNAFFRSATGFSTGTSYRYRLTVTSFSGSDVVPNTGQIDHIGVSASGTPTPPPTPPPTPTPTPTPVVGQQDTDTQNVTVNVQGVLSIDALLDLVNLGSVSSGGSSLATSVGQVDYTNTLNDGLNWNVSVAATKLALGALTSIDCTRMTFTPGSTFTSDPGSLGANPAAGSASAFSGACTNSAYSNPVTMATAAPASQGAYHQTGSTLQVAVPNTAPAGTYNGTLQYTITG